MTHGRAITATPGMLLGALGRALLSPPQTAELGTKEPGSPGTVLVSRGRMSPQATPSTPGPGNAWPGATGSSAGLCSLSALSSLPHWALLCSALVQTHLNSSFLWNSCSQQALF